MSYSNKNFSQPSILKPIIAVVAVLLVFGIIYSVSSNKPKTNQESDNKETNKVKPTGLDQDKRVTNVKDVEEVVAKWIETNPQMVIDSIQKMQVKMMEEHSKNAQKNISSKKDDLLNDKTSPEYAPSGYDVTIVEFFDYSCGYCKKAQPTIEELIKSDSKVRIIYKDFPILGQVSTEMAQVSIAVSLAEPKGFKKFHDALMSSNEKGKSGALKIAKSVGINTSKIEVTLNNEKDKINKIIEKNIALGSSIGVNGTPGFVIGEDLIPGAVDISEFKAKIQALRDKK
jgi:protein-disulfide isomerase